MEGINKRDGIVQDLARVGLNPNDEIPKSKLLSTIDKLNVPSYNCSRAARSSTATSLLSCSNEAVLPRTRYHHSGLQGYGSRQRRRYSRR